MPTLVLFQLDVASTILQINYKTLKNKTYLCIKQSDYMTVYDKTIDLELHCMLYIYILAYKSISFKN